MTCDAAPARLVAARPAAKFGSATALIAFATFVIVTSEFIVISLLPAIASDLGVSLAEAGWLVTWFALAAAIAGPPLTMLAMRKEPKLIMLVTAAIVAAGNLAVVLAPRFETLIIVRIVQGCALTVFVSVSTVAAARLAGVGREGRALAFVNTGVVAATVLGIPAGAMIADKASWPASFASLAVLGVMSIGLIATWFPRVSATEPNAHEVSATPWQRTFMLHLLLSGLLFTAMFTGYSYVAALLIAAGFSGTAIGWMLAGFGLAGIVGNLIAGYAADRDALAATAAVALVIAVAMAVVGHVTHAPALLAIVIGVWGAAHMAAFVVCQVRVMQVGRAMPAPAMSLNISVCNLGIALGALFGGWIVNHSGVEYTGSGGGAAAAVAIVVAIAMIAVRPRAKAPSEPHSDPS